MFELVYFISKLINYLKFTGSITEMEELQRNEIESKRQDQTEQRHLEDLAHTVHQESHSQAHSVQHPIGG